MNNIKKYCGTQAKRKKLFKVFLFALSQIDFFMDEMFLWPLSPQHLNN